jgi:hypothetical protein
MCETSTRPFPGRFREPDRGHTRSYDFCRWMSPRARLWTARTSRAAESAHGTTALLRLEVAFRPGQPPKLLEVRGRATDARHSRSRLLASETWPKPRSLRAPGVARRHLPPVWSDTMEELTPPASSALARRTRRQGGGAADIREDAQRSPARGAFCHKDVRERTGANLRAEADRPRAGAFFTTAECVRGTLVHTRHGPESRRKNEQAHHPPTRRSAPE